MSDATAADLIAWARNHFGAWDPSTETHHKGLALADALEAAQRDADRFAWSSRTACEQRDAQKARAEAAEAALRQARSALEEIAGLDSDEGEYMVNLAKHVIGVECPEGCGCVLGTDDADAADCDCDGPCCFPDRAALAQPTPPETARSGYSSEELIAMQKAALSGEPKRSGYFGWATKENPHEPPEPQQ